MKKAPLLLLGIFVFVAAFDNVSPVSARNVAVSRSSVVQGTNSITGFVFTEGRQPLSSVYVELQSEYYTTVSRIKTSGSGFYSFRGLKAGNYYVKVMPYGTDYIEQTKQVSLIPISAIPNSGGISEQADFYLKVKSVSEGPLGSPGVIFAQDVPDAAKKLYEQGIGLLRDKKEEEGFNVLKKSLETYPDYFLALDRLGTEYVIRGYYRPAYVLLSKAIEVNPRSFSSNFGLGLAQYHLQLNEASIESLTKAVSLNDKSVNAQLWLGIVLHLKGKLTEAETALNKADKLTDGKSAEVHWQLARLYSAQNKYAEAADQLELFLKFRPEANDAEKIKQTVQQLRAKVSKQ